MADQYDFGNLSPIEFESLVVDLMGAELGVRFEIFSEGADGGIDARHSSAVGNIILQAKHYKGSTWSDLKTSAKKEHPKLLKLDPNQYYFLTSQKLTPTRKDDLKKHLNHPSVITSNILGRTELNALLKIHGEVEKRNIKLWLSSAAVLQRLLTNDIAVFTEATMESIDHVLKVFVANPSLPKAADILEKQHCLIVSGPPGVGKTTLAQVLSAEYCKDGWELVALSSIEDGNKAFHPEKKQVFIFDDFLGTIKLDAHSLAKDDGKIAAFMKLVSNRDTKRFILTTRKYILQSARTASEALDDFHVELAEMVLDLDVYTREIKARILYNHLYHSGLEEAAIGALLKGDTVARIVDHRHYMPRIVEWMTDHIRFRDALPEDYPKAFLQALDNPEKIWEKPFKQHISQEARILLYCMYFSKFEGYPRTGVDLSKLRLFFERALVSFEIELDGSVQENKFKETIREVKSSFIVLRGRKASFINPSVQDFLARQVEDKQLLTKLASAVPTFDAASALWAATLERFKSNPILAAPVVSSLLKTIETGNVAGNMRLDVLGDLLGELLLRENRSGFIQFLRTGGLAKNTWFSESNLPNLIDDLMFGKFEDFEFAPVYGRWLRLQLYKYLSQTDYIHEIEELGTLADNLANCREEMPECLQEQLEQAVTESIDSLDLNSIPQNEDAEVVVGYWLEELDKVGDYLGQTAFSWKKNEFEEFLGNIQWQHEMDMERHRDERRLSRSSSSDDSIFQPGAPLGRSEQAKTGFSNLELNNLFSSLKK